MPPSKHVFDEQSLMSNHIRSKVTTSSLFSSDRDLERRNPGVGRYAMSQDEFSSGLQYQAPSLSEARSTGLSTIVSDNESEGPNDEYDGNPNGTESITSGNGGVSVASSTSTGGHGGDGFVTELPRTQRGLTDKISTLFRRASSRERAVRDATEMMSNGGGGVRRKKATRRSGDGTSRSNRRRLSTDQSSTTSSVEMSLASRESQDAGTHLSGVSRSETAVSARSRRILFTSHDDDGSVDSYSYESRKSQHQKKQKLKTGDRRSESPETLGSYEESNFSGRKTIVRYRGFSTSIKSLFLDETAVCASIGCFGIILSNRTEYLLNLRNERRGALKRHQTIERKKLPSRIVAYGLLVTIILMFATYIVWGTGDGLARSHIFYRKYVEGNEYDDTVAYNSIDDDANDDYYQNQHSDDGSDDNNNFNRWSNSNDDNDGGNNSDNSGDDAVNQNSDDGNVNYNINDDANVKYNGYSSYNQNNDDRNRRLVDQAVVFQHPVHGIFKLRDYHENLWHPAYELLWDEWSLLVELTTPGDDGDGETPSTPNYPRHLHMEDNGYVYDYDADQGDGEGRSFGDFANNIRCALLFLFLIFLAFLGRRRRMRTRFYLVRARAQEDHLFYASTQLGDVKYENSREDQYEGACSHTICGWYLADDLIEDEDDVECLQVTDSGIFKHKNKYYNEDIVACTFNVLMFICCGFAYKCWFQCMSICALAQEAREIRLLVPLRYQRIDYLTHQPFHEYQKYVNDLRRGWLGKSRKKSGIRPHWNALSRLSRYIIATFLIVISTVVGTLIYNPRVAFSWPDTIILGATFLQSFLVLLIVHGIFHKSDLSLDAVIKMFAAGFLIAVPSAFFFEGLFSNTLLVFAYSWYELIVWIGGDPVAGWIDQNWLIIWFIGEIMNAYLVAAVTEELCKYYTFRAVEHPDLVFLTGLTQDQAGVESGQVNYPFASHQVQELNRTGSFGDESQHSHRSNDKSRSSKPKELKLIERTGTMEEEFEEDEADVRTYLQRAMAITTGMISVALGLACAENFLYVLVFGGADSTTSSYSGEDRRDELLEEWIILVFRSIFPIHALSAALQSINMIRKFVESDGHNGHRIGVGRILLPAVLLHGTFDAILMSVNFYQERSWESYLKEHEGEIQQGDSGLYKQLVANMTAGAGMTTVMVAGIMWFYREHRRQRDRLKILEEKVKGRRSRGDSTSWDAQHGDVDSTIV